MKDGQGQDPVLMTNDMLPANLGLEVDLIVQPALMVYGQENAKFDQALDRTHRWEQRVRDYETLDTIVPFQISAGRKFVAEDEREAHLLAEAEEDSEQWKLRDPDGIDEEEVKRTTDAWMRPAKY